MPEDYDLETLANGVTVAWKRVPNVPDIAMATIFKVGRFNVPAGLEEAAHFAEHMLFKPTPRLQTNIPGLIKDITGRDVAGTGAETHPELVVARNRFPEKNGQPFLKVLSELVGNVEFDPVEVEKERQIIVHEAEVQYVGANVLLEKVSLALWPGYFRLVQPENAQNLRLDVITDFKKEAMGGGALVLVLVGAVTSETLKWISEYFGQLRSQSKQFQYSPPSGAEKVLLAADFEGQSSVLYTKHWQAPLQTNSDSVLVSVLLEYLAGGLSSRLGRRLRDELPVLHGIGSDYTCVGSAAISAISISEFPSNYFENVVSVINEELEQARNGKFDEHALDAIRKASELNFYDERRERLASRRASIIDQVIFGRPSDSEILRLSTQFSSHDIARVAQKYFMPNSVDILVTPKGQLPAGVERTVLTI